MKYRPSYYRSANSVMPIDGRRGGGRWPRALSVRACGP